MKHLEGWGWSLTLVAVYVLCLGQAAQALPYRSQLQQVRDLPGEMDRVSRELAKNWAGQLGLSDRELSLALAWAERSPLQAQLKKLRPARTPDGRLALDLSRVDASLARTEAARFSDFFQFPQRTGKGTPGRGSRLGSYPSSFSPSGGTLAVSEKMLREQLAGLGMDPGAVDQLLSQVRPGDLATVPQGVNPGWGAGDADWRMQQNQESEKEKKKIRLITAIAFLFLALLVLFVGIGAGGVPGTIVGIIAFIVLVMLAIYILDKGDIV